VRIANGLDCIGVAWGFAPDGELETAGAVAVVETAGELVTTIGRLETVHAAAMSGVTRRWHCLTPSAGPRGA
jgi:phosphoglycolate phosphatase